MTKPPSYGFITKVYVYSHFMHLGLSTLVL